MDCDVLVAGAGPTGLTAAMGLAERGVSVRIVDAAPVRPEESRALVVQCRTLELLHRHALAEPLRDRGMFARSTTLYADGSQVITVDLRARAPKDSLFDGVLFVSQVETERVLASRLEALGLPVERPVVLRSFDQDDEGVTCQLDGPAGRTSLRCRWLIGADGAHSVVRKGLGLSFEGAPYRAEFLLGDVRLDTDLDLDGLHVFLSRTGATILFPMPGERVRVVTTAATGMPEGAPLALDELERRATSMAHRDLRLSDPVWLARFHLHHRGVDRYRHRRGFVAGDAAHIHSPAGGQGMNTGIQDAYNLAWKLAMVCRGEAPEALLDTYHHERHPIGQKLLRFTDRAFEAATHDAAWFTGLRNTLLPLVAPRVATIDRQERVVRYVSQLGIRYRASALNGQLGDFAAGPEPGDRLQDPRCVGSSWWLLGTSNDPRFRAPVEGLAASLPWLSVAWGPPAHGLRGAGLLMVRPDGHLAFRSSGARLDPLLEWLAEHGLEAS